MYLLVKKYSRIGKLALLVLLFGCLAENDPMPVPGDEPILARVEMDDKGRQGKSALNFHQ